MRKLNRLWRLDRNGEEDCRGMASDALTALGSSTLFQRHRVEREAYDGCCNCQQGVFKAYSGELIGFTAGSRS